MHSIEDEDFNIEDYNVNLRMVTFIIVIMIIVLTLIYFVRIYSNKKDSVLKEMQSETLIVDTVISDHLNYSKYFINLISASIKDNYHDIEYVQKQLEMYFKSNDFNNALGWRKYSWIDSNFNEVVSSTKGTIYNPKKKNYLKKIFDNSNRNNEKFDTIFYTSQINAKEHSLKIINIVHNKINNKSVGAVVLSYDINTMIANLNNRKRNPSSNFIILDENLDIVASSKPNIDNIINNEKFSKHISKVIEKIKLNQNEETSYLDMVNGLNYHIKKLKDLPFSLLVNIDNNIIRENILDSVTKKFIEVSILAFACLFMIISIYKRETILRAKAENATKTANDATKAKTNFLAFTAHEVRSPLGFILTGSEIMTKELLGPLPPSYIKYAEGIHEHSKLILDFITDILDENQIIEGKFKIVNSVVILTSIIEEAITQNINRYNKKKVTIIRDFEDNLPLLICDRRRILQVISNLISNSIKYSKEKIEVTIEAKTSDGSLIIIVSDKGVGMSNDDIKVALSTYGSMQYSKDYPVGSYGLGLPIVKMLLDAHDAKIAITSTAGQGTSVRIFFPKYKLVYNTKDNKILQVG